MFTEKVDVLLLAPTQLQLFAKRWGSGTVKGKWFKSDMQDTAQADMLDMLFYPQHRNYYHATAKRLALLREEGFDGHRVPIIDVMDYPMATRKKLRISTDEADAYHAARCAYRFWEFIKGNLTEGELTPSEWDLFIKTHTFTRGAKKGTTERKGISFKEGARFYRFATGS